MRSVAFSPDGTILAGATDDGAVRIWDAKANKEIATLRGHSRFVNSVAFSPDGGLLASGSADHTVLLWSVDQYAPTAEDDHDKGRAITTWARLKDGALAPVDTALLANYPNPFNPETWIPYQLGEDAHVSISIYDATGRVIRLLDMGQRPTGYYRTPDRAAHWDGRNDAGELVSSGAYYAEMVAGDYRKSRRLIVLK